VEYKSPDDHVSIKEAGAGIYLAEGDILPIQIIDSRELSGIETIKSFASQ
jgi:hypothetical protein